MRHRYSEGVCNSVDVVARAVITRSSPTPKTDAHILLTFPRSQADVWAMGVLLCVSLIGKFPFEGDSVSTMAVNDPMKKVRGS